MNEKIYFVPKSYEHLVWSNMENGYLDVLQKISMLIRSGISVSQPQKDMRTSISWNKALKENKPINVCLTKRRGYTVVSFTF